jgi:hypothetical protein
VALAGERSGETRREADEVFDGVVLALSACLAFARGPPLKATLAIPAAAAILSR